MSASHNAPLPYSEDWWRVTLSSIGDAVIVTDARAKVIFMNPPAESLTGWLHADAASHSIEEVFPIINEKSRTPVRSPIAKVLEGGIVAELENHTVLISRNGTEVAIDDSAAPIKDGSGKILGVVLVFRNVTERKRAQEGTQRLAAIIECSMDAIVGEDLVGNITIWNNAAERLFGYRASEVLGQRNALVAIPAEATGSHEPPKPLPSVEQYEAIGRRKDGTTFDASITTSPIRDEDGGIIGASRIIRDITDQKRALGERAYLAAIVDSSDDAIVGKTLDSVITSWNHGAERMFGFTAEEAIGQKVYLIIPEERHAEEPEIVSRLRRGERIEHYETVRRRKEGTPIDVSLTVSPIRDARGNIIGASKIARDITQKKAAELQLKLGHAALETINRVGQALSSELDLQKLVQTLTDAATTVTGAAFGAFFYNVVDERGASYMLYTLSGAPREHFAHFPMPRATDLFGPTFRGEGVIRIADVKKNPRYGKNSPYFGMPEGHLPVRSYLAAPVVSRSGTVLGGLFFGHPETGVFTQYHEDVLLALANQAASAMDNARLYENLSRAHADAQTANRLKDEFLATVSHELRTPLNAILGWARLLHMGNLDDHGRSRAVETIERSAVAQDQIIEDILDVSRIITGKLRLDVAPVDIGKLLNDAIDSIKPAAEGKGIRLKTILDTRATLVRGDGHRLQQVFWNLLSNAVKFTPKGGHVNVSLAPVDSHVEVVVSDSGQGISREFIPYVFERFRQADSSTKRRHSGLGLGLAIVRHLTELHGGTVSADSAGEGKGATFTVRLPPAVLRDEQEATFRKRAPVARAVEGAVPPGQNLAGVRVLVVDDEADARELLTVVLEKAGASVKTAGSASEGFALFQEWRPDVIVSDIGMAGEDGYEFIARIRALPHQQGGSVPATALTAYATAEDRLRVLTAGFQTHIGKPVEPMELTAVVAILAGRSGIAKDR